jgi:hypothetical protein
MPTDSASAAPCSIPAAFGKQETFLWPAVGRLHHGGTCTAALVGPGKILTAAHCLAVDIPQRATFTVDGRVYRVIYAKRARTDGNTGPDDVAVGWLDREVVGVVPLGIGHDPGAGPLAFVGYGCNDMCIGDGYKTSLGTGVKRHAFFSGESFRLFGYESESWFLCPGDSGGPVVRLDTMEIVGVASSIGAFGRGPDTTFTHMYFADPLYALQYL